MAGLAGFTCLARRRLVGFGGFYLPICLRLLWLPCLGCKSLGLFDRQQPGATWPLNSASFWTPLRRAGRPTATDSGARTLTSLSRAVLPTLSVARADSCHKPEIDLARFHVHPDKLHANAVREPIAFASTLAEQGMVSIVVVEIVAAPRLKYAPALRQTRHPARQKGRKVPLLKRCRRTLRRCDPACNST